MEPTIEHKNEISKEVKTIAFLEVTMFSDLFTNWVWHTQENASVFQTTPGVEQVDVPKEGRIGNYCTCFRTDLDNSLRVAPTVELLRFIRKSMIMPDYDTIDFKLIQRKDGLLIAAANNAIIASRWLALVPLSELETIRARADENEARRI